MFALLGLQTIDNISQALPVGKLTKTQADKLVPTGKTAHSVVTFVFGYAALKLLSMNQTEQLSEYIFTLAHKSSEFD